MISYHLISRSRL